MPVVKDFNPDNFNDDPNYDYQLTSKLDLTGLKNARAAAAANIANTGSSVPQASTLAVGNTTPRATPATELSGRVTNDLQVRRVDLAPKTATIAPAATLQLVATVTPSHATTKTVSYASNNTAAATVNSSTGLVTGVASGVTSKVTLTSNGTNVTDGDTVTLDGVVYRFKTTPTQAYDVKIGASADATLKSLKAAVNASGVVGTDYFTGTNLHPTITGTTNTTTTQVFESKTKSASNNTLASTKSAATYTFSAATLTGGASNTAVITATTTDQSKTATTTVYVV